MLRLNTLNQEQASLEANSSEDHLLPLLLLLQIKRIPEPGGTGARNIEDMAKPPPLAGAPFIYKPSHTAAHKSSSSGLACLRRRAVAWNSFQATARRWRWQYFMSAPTVW